MKLRRRPRACTMDSQVLRSRFQEPGGKWHRRGILLGYLTLGSAALLVVPGTVASVPLVLGVVGFAVLALLTALGASTALLLAPRRVAWCQPILVGESSPMIAARIAAAHLTGVAIKQLGWCVLTYWVLASTPGIVQAICVDTMFGFAGVTLVALLRLLGSFKRLQGLTDNPVAGDPLGVALRRAYSKN